MTKLDAIMKRYKLILSLLLPVSMTIAETPFEDFIVGIWPEYDHPGVLILYQGTVKEGNLPLHFEVATPPHTRFVLGFGQSDTTSKLLPLNVEEREDGNWAVIDIIQPTFQVEFYYNPFTEDPYRAIDFPMRVSQDISDFHIVVQQPAAAEKFVFIEPEAETFTDEYGVTYHRISESEYIAGSTREISVRYENPTGKISKEVLSERFSGSSVQGSQNQLNNEKQEEGYQLSLYEPLLILGVLSVIIGYIFWRNNKRIINVKEDRKLFYCTQCGNKLRQGNKFCSNCGKRI